MISIPSPRAGSLLSLLLLLALAAPAAWADEWNDSFARPRPYRVLRGIAVRGGPGNSHQRLGSVAEGDVLMVSEIVNGWNRFDYNGRQGWIFKRYLRPMAAGELEDTAAAPSPAEQPSVVPETQTAPDTQAAPLAEAEPDAVSRALAELEKQARSVPTVRPVAPPRPAPAKKEAPPAEEEVAPAEEEVAPAEEAPPAEEEPAPAPPQPSVVASVRPPKPVAPEIVPQTVPQTVIEDEPLKPLEEDTPPSAAKTAPEAEVEKPKLPVRELKPAELADCRRFISLQPGEESRQASISGVLEPGEKACFRILALEDWVLEITVTSESDAARFDVFTPTQGRLASAMTAWAHPVRFSGDKQIVVYGGQAPIRYTLGVQVR